MTTDSDLTGNDYVSIPVIGRDGTIDGVNVLVAAAAGLVEWVGPDGGSLLRLRINVDGVDIPIENARWLRLDRWIPTFTATLADDSTVTGTICAPGGYASTRGFLIRIELDHRGRSSCELRVELDITWQSSRLRIATARPLPERNRLLVDAAGRVLVLETDGGRGPALAIATNHDPELWGGCDASVALERLNAHDVIDAPNDSLLCARVSQSTIVKSNSRGSLVLNIGAGRERDGAVTAALGMARFGADDMLRKARLELSHVLRPAQDHRWAEMLNRNLLFNRYYAVGRAIDDDRLYLLRSRSPACPDGALFNEREALFWTLPALVIADPMLAREAMFRVLDLASERAGEHVRYIDGGAYDAAFILDQYLLHAWAVSYYADVTGDTVVLDDPMVRQMTIEADSAAFAHLHPQHMLAVTDLLPSGDVADYPYATMANVLLNAFCKRLPVLLPPGESNAAPPMLLDAAAEVEAAIWQHCVSDVDGDPVLASSTNLEGEAAVYNDPAMSLALLPFLGFCAQDDPVWRATMDFLRSPRYPLWRTGAIPGLAARSGDPRPKTAALCADLLADRPADALDRLLRLRMPGGVAAGGYDVEGLSFDEPHHAALAGFLAWTLVRAVEPKDELAGRRKKRR